MIVNAVISHSNICSADMPTVARGTLPDKAKKSHAIIFAMNRFRDTFFIYLVPQWDSRTWTWPIISVSFLHKGSRFHMA